MGIKNQTRTCVGRSVACWTDKERERQKCIARWHMVSGVRWRRKPATRSGDCARLWEGRTGRDCAPRDRPAHCPRHLRKHHNITKEVLDIKEEELKYIHLSYFLIFSIGRINHVTRNVLSNLLKQTNQSKFDGARKI